MSGLTDCFKVYTKDLDKALPPEETVERVLEVFNSSGKDILAEIKRIDTGRLGIPVYISVCGPEAKRYLPGRKQMGKGSSVIQAKASALMELVERYSYFSFWKDESRWFKGTWSEAAKRTEAPLMPVQEILKSVNDDLDETKAVRILDLLQWKFATVENVLTGRVEYAPVDWFKILNEFNGTSAGNTHEESILQGGCELVERHVSALVDRGQPILPTIDPASFTDPVLKELVRCFEKNGVRLWLKDFTLDMPVPTVGALAWDPHTFPDYSEIVYTAGTASSPEKAAIRAVTEVAQLAGDFESGSNYEASGLCKFLHPDECKWLEQGERIAIDALPNIADTNIRSEVETLCRGLEKKGFTLYSKDVSHQDLGIPAHYNFIPGFLFRERTPHASLGLFVGRILAENHEPEKALAGFELLDECYPGNHFTPFFRGMIGLRQGELDLAEEFFAAAEPLQPSSDDTALVAFYRAYAMTQEGKWAQSMDHLNRAIELVPDSHAYYNLRGVANFKQGRYESAVRDFHAALEQDKGSAMDLANLGMCYKAMGKPKVAADYLENALELDPGLDFAKQSLDELQQNMTR